MLLPRRRILRAQVFAGRERALEGVELQIVDSVKRDANLAEWRRLAIVVIHPDDAAMHQDGFARARQVEGDLGIANRLEQAAIHRSSMAVVTIRMPLRLRSKVFP